MEWFRFLGVVLALYLIFNCAFACAYFESTEKLLAYRETLLFMTKTTDKV